MASNSKHVTSRVESSEGRPLGARILLADDNDAIVDCVAEMLLDAEYDMVGAVTSGQCVVSEAEKTRPDVLILDVSMGEVSGFEVAGLLQRRGFLGKIVFLTVHEDQDFMKAAIAAGGSAYVVKSRLDLDLLPAIRAALCGRLFVSAPLQFDSNEQSA